MKTNIDFDKIGKNVPYQIPEGFFEEVQRNVMQEVAPPVTRRRTLLKFIPLTAVAAAALAALIYIPLQPKHMQNEEMSQVVVAGDWIENLTDEELESLDVFSDSDIFMYNYNE